MVGICVKEVKTINIGLAQCINYFAIIEIGGEVFFIHYFPHFHQPGSHFFYIKVMLFSFQGLASASEQGFRDQLCNYWFTRYSRSQGKAMDSSGFEHVFAGELKSTTASGFHNWVQFYRQEEKGNLKYSNYLQGCDVRKCLNLFLY